MDTHKQSDDQPLNEAAARRARAPIIFILALFLLAIVVLAVWPRAVAGSDSAASGKDQPGASPQSSSPPAPGKNEEEAVEPTKFCTRFEKKSFTLATGKLQKGDLYFFGKTARIDGTLEGDVFVFGESAVVGGTVTEGLNAAVAHVLMNGKVGDDVRIVCQDASINGSIGGDLLAGGNTITTLPTASVQGRTLIAAGRAFLSGHF